MELQGLPGMSSKEEARRMLKDAIPTMAEVPSPPNSPRWVGESSRGGEGTIYHENRSGNTADYSADRSDGSKECAGGYGAASEGEGVGGGGAPGVGRKRDRLKVVRCDLCGDEELSLCSTMVEGPTWQEAVSRRLEQVR